MHFYHIEIIFKSVEKARPIEYQKKIMSNQQNAPSYCKNDLQKHFVDESDCAVATGFGCLTYKKGSVMF